MGSFIAGLGASIIVLIPIWAYQSFGKELSSPFLVFAVLACLGFAPVLYEKVLKGLLGSSSGKKTKFERFSRYDGLANLIEYIHTPSRPEPSIFWFFRAITSFFLTLLGGFASSEGAAIEALQGFAIEKKHRFFSWFETQRRSNVSIALSGGISASFGFPFLAVILPLELGTGGRILNICLAALGGWAGREIIGRWFGIQFLDPSEFASAFQFSHWAEWLGFVSIWVLASFMAWLVIRMSVSMRTLIGKLSKKEHEPWLRFLVGGGLLTGLAWMFPLSEVGIWWEASSRILNSELSLLEASWQALRGIVVIVVLAGCFGTLGLFWPLVVSGLALGLGSYEFLFSNTFAFLPGFGVMAAVSGAVAFWAVALNAPLSGALLAYGLTSNVSVVVPTLILGGVVSILRKKLGVSPLYEQLLFERGVRLMGGRSLSVLETIQVREAMVFDHETVSQKEPLEVLQERLINSRHPFMPVVDEEDKYVGLITVEMLDEGMSDKTFSGASEHLTKLIEARDFLVGSHYRAPTVRADETLSEVVAKLATYPCLPVLDENYKVIGLLFGHNVRLAYDREVVRQALAAQK